MKITWFKAQYHEGYVSDDYREWVWFCVDRKIHMMRGREYCDSEILKEWHGEITACDGSCITAMEIELTQEEQVAAQEFERTLVGNRGNKG